MGPLGKALAFLVVSEQKDVDAAENSATSSYGLMSRGALTPTRFSWPIYCSVIRSPLSQRFFPCYLAFRTLYLVADRPYNFVHCLRAPLA